MKFASGAWRIKQVGYGSADNRADNTEHNCPRDREMRLHERLGDAACEKTDKDIPDEVKHIFLLTLRIGNQPSNSKIADPKATQKR
jgi:hypothetical protein